MGLRKLTPKQEQFACKYVECGNASKAYRFAYPKSRKWKVDSVKKQASMTLHLPHVLQRVKALQGATSETLLVAPDSVLREYARLGFSDIRKLFEENGALKAIHTLDDSIAAAVSSVKVVTKNQGEGDIEYVHEIRLWPKNPALDSLAKNLGLFREDNEQRRTSLTVIMSDLDIGGLPANE